MQPTLSAQTILEILKTTSDDTEWTSRTILEAIELPKHRKNRRACRTLLHTLWKERSIQRKVAMQDDHSIVYVDNSVELEEAAVPCDVCAFPVNKKQDVTLKCSRCAGPPRTRKT